MTDQARATGIGFLAILLWSSVVGLIKEVSHFFGPTAGAALTYTVASLFLLFTMKWIPLHKFPKRYLIFGGLLLVAYELCLALSIGYTQDNKQAIEVGMVNYLWPTFTMLATIVFTAKKASWLVVPGIILSMVGIVWVLGGNDGFSFSDLIRNIRTNTLSYALALIGALLWAAYCVVTIRLAQGMNGITPFFITVALVLWMKYFILGETVAMQFTINSISYLLLAASAMGFGYAAWNIGILRGHVLLLNGVSYFIPVMSSALSSFLLATKLDVSFWRGASMVCAGSILCWLSTRKLSHVQRRSTNPSSR